MHVDLSSIFEVLGFVFQFLEYRRPYSNKIDRKKKIKKKEKSQLFNFKRKYDCFIYIYAYI